MSADVLERNVRALLRRSYVPALPAPTFRDRLEVLFLSEVARRAPSGARDARFLRYAALAAAALLALFLGWRLFAPAGGDARAQLVARGEVALGFADGAWRAADAEERVHGLVFSPPALTVVTPASVELDLLLAAGRVHVDARSELALEQQGAEVAATLRAGSARFLSTEGSADERIELVAGATRTLPATRPTSPAPIASTDEPAPREALAPGAASTNAPVVPAATRGLSGTVVAAEGGAPLAEFRVALLPERLGNSTRPPLVRAFTDADGAFRWPAPPPGKQRVFVHAPGYALCALGEHDLTSEALTLRAELVVGVSVRGSVLDEQGNAVPDAWVVAEDETPADGLLFSLAKTEQEFGYWLPIQARTGPDGRFELAHLNPGVHALRASAAELAPSWKDGVRVPSATNDELEFTLAKGGAIQGRIARADGGPFADAELVVVAMNDKQRPRSCFDYVRSDAEGRYRFEHLPPDTMIVVLLSRDSTTAAERPDVRPVQVVTGQTVTADFVPPKSGIRLHGRVLAHDGKPVAGQNLGLFDAETASWNQDWVATSTLADGAYAFEGVQPGRYEMFLVNEMGGELRCVDAFALAADVRDVEHEVRVPGTRLAVTAFDARDAQPLAQTALVVMRVEGDGRESFSSFSMSDAEGRVDIVGLRPGTYYVEAYPSRAGLGFADSERITLVDGESATLELALEAGGAVDVVVRDPAGRPLEGAAVVFHDERGREHLFARLPLTDAAGRFRASALRPGRYRVEASLAGYQGTPVEFRYELGRELEVPLILTPLPPR